MIESSVGNLAFDILENYGNLKECRGKHEMHYNAYSYIIIKKEK